jgi:hypothetical protein
VGERVPNIDAAGAIRKFRNDGLNAFIEGEFSVIDQKQGRERRELLRNRGQIRNRSGRERNAMLEVGHAVADRQDGLAIAHNPYRTTWTVPGEGAEQAVDV